MNLRRSHKEFIDSTIESLLTFLEISPELIRLLDLSKFLGVTGYLIEASEHYSIKPTKIKKLLKAQRMLLTQFSKPQELCN